MKKITIYSLIIFIIDQITKLIISFNMELNTSIPLIKNFFNISNVHNYGAAFSILYGNRILLISVSIIVLFAIYYFLLKTITNRKIDIIIYSLLVGGITGNLFDRIVYGYVIDYLDFKIFGYNFPIFNIADICIVISMIALIIDMLVGEKNETKCRDK
ncbi:MAG: signal peptidase II [Bacilli bacterium]|nr:signal peptidase II [Bacilli bacterium]